MTGARDVGWGALAAVMAVALVGNVVGVVAAGGRGDVLQALSGVAGLFAAYWIGMGAWRRTTWGVLLGRE
ncbi:MAG TPA: hypothetical protein VM938_07755 [Acidimicrobiales bacterium]|nr:hypothetical protein [Acidimicrobiales bacterium]